MAWCVGYECDRECVESIGTWTMQERIEGKHSKYCIWQCMAYGLCQLVFVVMVAALVTSNSLRNGDNIRLQRVAMYACYTLRHEHMYD